MIIKRIRDLREDKDLKQIDVSNAIQIKLRTYGLYESGSIMVPPHVLIAIANFHNVSLDYLLGRTNNPAALSKSNMPIPEKFEMLFYLRRKHHYSQKQLAEMLHISQNGYSNYERGIRTVPPEILVSLANIYQVSTDYLLGQTDDSKMY